MKGDIVIFIAFCVFLLLWGLRMRQRLVEQKAGGEVMPGKAGEQRGQELQNRQGSRERRSRFWTTVQWVVLGGLIVYMVPVLIRDLGVWENVGMPAVFLRCLIFVFTIYIFLLLSRKLFGKKHKEKAKE